MGGCPHPHSDGDRPAGVSQEDESQAERQWQEKRRQRHVVDDRGRGPGVRPVAAARLALALGLLAQQAAEAGRALAAKVVQAHPAVLTTQHLVVTHAG